MYVFRARVCVTRARSAAAGSNFREDHRSESIVYFVTNIGGILPEFLPVLKLTSMRDVRACER